MLNIITALPSEAHAIIEHFALAPIETHRPPHVYGNAHIRLAISGVGQTKSALAVEHLALTNSNTNSTPNAWINVGIAGHRSAELGDCFLVDKIVDAQNKATVYPSIPYRTRLKSCCLRTVVQPENDYPHNSLYDMEGYSFFTAAQQFSTLELIVLLKVVSDNQEQPVHHINKSMVRAYISGALCALDETLEKLQTLATENFDSPVQPEISWRRLWHTTHAQQLILSGLSQRLALLDESIDVPALVTPCKTAEEAIVKLEMRTADVQLRIANLS